jgi:hypothetical protein
MNHLMQHQHPLKDVPLLNKNCLSQNFSKQLLKYIQKTYWPKLFDYHHLLDLGD